MDVVYKVVVRHDHGSDSGSDEEMDEHDRHTLLNGKIALIVVIGFVTFFASLIPWSLRTAKLQRHAMSILTIGMCFAGGVVLGSAFVHLLPTSADTWTEYFEEANPEYSQAGYPFAQMICGFSLLILLGVDKIALSHGMEGHTDDGHGHNHMVVDIPKSESETDLNCMEDGKTKKLDESTEVKNSALDNVSPKEQRERIIQAWIFFLALSLHSIFDGMSIGAEQTLEDFYALIIAVLSHKLLDGFALGVPVYLAKFPLWQTLSALIFCAAMTPLGIGIGMAATEGTDSHSSVLARAIILSLSTGSFFFISLFELIPSGISKHGWVKVKVALCFAGFGLMALLGIWV